MTERLKTCFPTLKRLRKVGEQGRKKILQEADDELYECLCDCVHNTLNSSVPLTKLQFKKLSRHKKILRKLENNVRYRNPVNMTKCGVVERVNRTLKERMHRYFTHKGTQNYIDVLPDLVKGYNNTVHSAIGRKPSEVNKENEKEVYRYLYEGAKALGEEVLNTGVGLLKDNLRGKSLKESVRERVTLAGNNLTKRAADKLETMVGSGLKPAKKPELSPRVIIEDATLYVRKITLNPSILLAHAKILQQKTALYHFRRTEMLHYTIGQNVFQKSVENMLNGRVPQRIIMGLMKNSAFNGSYTQNVFNFEHFNLNYLNLSINGMTVGGKPLTPNYATGEYMQPYLMTFFGTGIGLSDDGHCISRDDFPNGFCLYCWDLTPDLSASEAHWSSTQDGNIRIEVGFAKELETTVSMIVYAEYRETLEIDRSRQCSLVYKG
ncbi:uncharacterized protein F54H12.2-like [Neocloeon triangulifer]|uniref:uncharacterized protein F54H12.2-like n=1 Tax=Neocloeon triangulifer TaxID=2078957 RepID=UPI00286F7C67|nr:uncharacterized protein F54H12.2-like [Neocloeon triangulifer]